jgi:hypothetical protein
MLAQWPLFGFTFSLLRALELGTVEFGHFAALVLWEFVVRICLGQARTDGRTPQSISPAAGTRTAGLI